MLFANGCSGTTQKLDFSQPKLMYDPVIEERSVIHIVCYFTPEKKESVAPLLQDWIWKNSPDTKVQWVFQKARNWMEEWKKNFKPFKAAGLTITPSWLYSAKKNKLSKTVILDPGMAFGTGHHATTRFAMELLAVLNKKKKIKGKEIIDVGAGSGILSVVAERFGAKHTLAIDNDPECWRESRKTFKLNKIKKSKVSPSQIQKIKKSYDIVIANIIDGILLVLKEDLWRITKPKGYIILSGVLMENADKFIQDFCQGKDSTIIKQIQDKEWTAFLVQKK